MLCWAGNWVVGRAIHEQVPPLTLNFWRWAGSLLLILPFAWAPLRAQWRLMLRHWKWVLPMAAIASAIFQSMVYLGLQSTTALNGALLVALVPVAVAVIAAAVPRMIGTWRLGSSKMPCRTARRPRMKSAR